MAHISRSLLFLLLIGSTSPNYAALINAEPDSYPAGSDLTNSFTGVTLTVDGQPALRVISGTATLAGGCGPTPSPASCASTGVRVFAHSDTASNGDHWQQGIAELRATFSKPTDFVAIDLAGIDDGDAQVKAYSSAGVLLDTFVVHLTGPGNRVTASFSRPSPDISYILAGGVVGESNLLDNLQYNHVPSVITPVMKINASVNPRSKGLIPVTIFSSNVASGEPLDFDATQVDAATVTFGPNEAHIAHAQAHIEDVDGDGDPDLVLHFRVRATGIGCATQQVTLTGETFGGELIEATVPVRVVGCR